MGQSSSTRKYQQSEEDWPYVWAIRDAECLDWKIGKDGKSLSNDEIQTIAKRQSQLPVEITPYLQLSDAKRAHDVPLLKERGITHVLNVAGKAGEGPLNEYKLANIKYLNIEADDEEGYEMLGKHFKECYDFVETARSCGGSCVVHCVAGINRSGVIVASIMMMNEKKHVLDVVAHCRYQRGNCFLWNSTFQEELVAMARQEELLGLEPGNVESRVKVKAPVKTEDLFVNKTSTFNSKKIKGLF